MKGCARDERFDAVPLAWMLDTSTEYKLQVEASLRTFDSIGIAGSELGRPALAGLYSLATWVEEAIAKVKLCEDVTAQRRRRELRHRSLAPSMSNSDSHG